MKLYVHLYSTSEKINFMECKKHRQYKVNFFLVLKNIHYTILSVKYSTWVNVSNLTCQYHKLTMATLSNEIYKVFSELARIDAKFCGVIGI